MPEGAPAQRFNDVARFERPKRYVFVDTLPESKYGKVQKRELRGGLL